VGTIDFALFAAFHYCDSLGNFSGGKVAFCFLKIALSEMGICIIGMVLQAIYGMAHIPIYVHRTYIILVTYYYCRERIVLANRLPHLLMMVPSS